MRLPIPIHALSLAALAWFPAAANAATAPSNAAVAPSPAPVPAVTGTDWAAVINRPIEIQTTGGAFYRGVLLSFTADLVTLALTDTGSVRSIARNECVGIRLLAAPAPILPPPVGVPPAPVTPSEPPTGRGMGITAAVLMSVGVAQALAAGVPLLLSDYELQGKVAVGVGSAHFVMGCFLAVGAGLRRRNYDEWQTRRYWKARQHLGVLRPSVRLRDGEVMLGVGGRF